MSDSSSPDKTPRSSSAGAPGGWEPPTPEELQEMLPQYEITVLIGRGGMGAVYRGMQVHLDRPVAIKILPPGLDDTDATYSERFRNEALAMAKLNHPGIVGVYDFGRTDNGMLYIVMQFVDGTDVAQMMAEQKRLPAAHAMAITAHVCDALKYAHERGIVHRDIKPANIIVGYDGVVRVADFGLAKMGQSGQSTGLTQSGLAMGTMHYIAPEALTLGTYVDQRADIYAMGVMLYHMLTGGLPQGMFELPSLQVAGLDPRYDGIISRALRNDRELRYQTVVELRRDLDAILTQPVVEAKAGKEPAPAALNTMARPQRAAGQPYHPPQWQEPPPPARDLNLGFWVPVLAVVAALAGFVFWSEQGKPKVGPKVEAAAAGAAAAGVETDVPKPVFTNSLGMQFVPVAGTKVLMCIHETRNQDYRAYVAEVKGVNSSPIFSDKSAVDQAGDHPVRNVKYNDAAGFCEWLSKKEGRAYRLPTDEEWSLAMGLGTVEKRQPGDTPEKMSRGNIQEFPWGSSQWPPPVGFGNYGDTALNAAFPSYTFIEGYTDGFATTAPVMSFPPNRQGLYDMSGNVSEWVQDWWNAEQKTRTFRGGGYGSRERRDLQPSSRGHLPPDVSFGNANHGFRCVVKGEVGK